MQESKNLKKRMLQKGFTLVEMMVVVAVIGILGSVVGGKLIGNTEKARKAKAISEIQTYETAAEMYQLTYGKPISSLSQLYPEFLKDEPKKDPWDNDYVVNVESDGTVRVTSTGVTSDEAGGKASSQSADWGSK